MATNDFGWFGWFSAVGFAILAALYLVDMVAPDMWPFSAYATLTVALIAGIGAIALYFGNDPTADTRRETTT